MTTLQLPIQKLCVQLSAKLPPRDPESGRRARTIAVTSARSREGKTFVAAATALQLSKLGVGRVLCVDANFQRPDLHRRFNIPGDTGLYQCLQADAIDESAFFRSQTSELDILPAGKGADSGILFNQARVKKFLDAVAPRYEWIIFDSAEILESGGNGLLMLVDGLVVIVDSRATRWQIVKESLTHTGVNPDKILGVVLNKRRFEIPSFLYRWL